MIVETIARLMCLFGIGYQVGVLFVHGGVLRLSIGRVITDIGIFGILITK